MQNLHSKSLCAVWSVQSTSLQSEAAWRTPRGSRRALLLLLLLPAAPAAAAALPRGEYLRAWPGGRPVAS